MRFSITPPAAVSSGIRHLGRLLDAAVLFVLLLAPSSLAQPADGVAVITNLPHTSEITDVALSPSGRLLATTGTDLAIKLWHVSTGRLLRTFPAAHDRDGVTRDPRIRLQFAPDEMTLMSVGGNGTDGKIVIWETMNGRRLSTSAIAAIEQGTFDDAARSADGRDIAVCRFDMLALIRKTQVWSNKLELALGCRLQFSPDRMNIAVTFSDRTMMLAASTGKSVWERMNPNAGADVLGSELNAASQFQDDGRHLLMAQAGRGHLRVELVEGSSGTVIRSIAGPDCYTPSKVSRTGAVAALRYKSFSDDGPCKDESLMLTVLTIQGESLASIPITIGHRPTALTFSEDGRLLVTARNEEKDGRTLLQGILEFWDARTGALVRRISPDATEVETVEFSADGAKVLANRDGRIQIWNSITGRLDQLLQSKGQSLFGARIAGPDDAVIAGVATDRSTWEPDDDYAGRMSALRGGRPMFFDAATGKQRGDALCDDEWIIATGELDGARWVATVCAASNRLQIRGPAGAVIRSVALEIDKFAEGAESKTDTELRAWTFGRQIAISRDLSRIALVQGGAVTLQDATDGRVVLQIPSAREVPIIAVALSNDGRLLTHSTAEKAIVIEIATGRTVATLPSTDTARLAFSGADRYFAIKRYRGIAIFDTRNWREIASGGWASGTGASWRYFDNDRVVLRSVFVRRGATQQRLASSPADTARSLFSETIDGAAKVAFHNPTGRMAIASQRMIRILDATSGKAIGTLTGQVADVSSLAFSPRGDRVAAGGADGTVRIWSLDRNGSNRLLVTLFATADGRWLSITPAGFFAGSSDVTDTLHVTRGFDVTTLDRMHQSLFNPDIVALTLAGDADGEATAAAKVANLGKIIDSGPAPTVSFVSVAPGIEAGSDLVTLEATVADNGKGVGRIEWRVNGVTSAVSGVPPGSAAPTHTLRQVLSLDPGSNTIEVIAYNAANLLASPPARMNLSSTASAQLPKSVLHVLAIGINTYVDTGWIPPGKKVAERFAPLSLAVDDARAFAAAMRTSGGDLYSEVRVTMVLDENATRDNLDAIVKRLATTIQPRDTFILFAAAHGISHNGQFYLVTQNHQGGAAPDALARHAVSQDMLQDWLANSIKAKRALVLLDTCEAGALVAGHSRSRFESAASAAGVGRLHEATGRPVLTAAATGQFAHEGLIKDAGVKHGLFTWAVLDALSHGDSNGNGTIELSELVAHVQALVPQLASKLKGTGRAATAAPEPVFGRQSARFGSRGEDFSIVKRTGP